MKVFCQKYIKDRVNGHEYNFNLSAEYRIYEQFGWVIRVKEQRRGRVVPERLLADNLINLFSNERKLTVRDLFKLDVYKEHKVYIASLPWAFDGHDEWILGVIDSMVRNYLMLDSATREWAVKWIDSGLRDIDSMDMELRKSDWGPVKNFHHIINTVPSKRSVKAVSLCLGAATFISTTHYESEIDRLIEEVQRYIDRDDSSDDSRCACHDKDSEILENWDEESDKHIKERDGNQA